MTIWRVISTKGQGHHLAFDPGLLKYDIFVHLDPQKPLCQISCSLLGLWEQIFAQTVGGHMTSMTNMPKYGRKYFLNLLQNQLTYGIDNWYAASVTPVISRLFK